MRRTSRLGPMEPGLVETRLPVEGATCGACVARIESSLRAIAGVSSASFNLASHSARVLAEASVSRSVLEAAVARAGYRVAAEATEAPRHRVALWRTGVAGLAMMQVMMLAYPGYVAHEAEIAWDVERLLSLSSLAITLPVLLFSATPIWQGAWRGLRSRQPGMDLPVALGLLAALAASLPATWFGGPVYYDSITMFVFFLSAARLVEARALAASVSATQSLSRLLPARAIRVVEGRHEPVAPDELRAGDVVWIAVGEAAPADCALLESGTDFNEALITGESAPAAKRAGDSLFAGAVNLGRPVRARVVRAGPDHTLSTIARLVERAASARPRWARLADRHASHFVVAVVVLAWIASLAWLAIDPERALPVALAVLVVSCPCALSLAAPAALAAGAGALARSGVLATNADAIEALASVDRIVLDKTGTLTTGRMRLAEVQLLGTLTRERCLEVAAALERAMPHPVAHALVAASAPASGATDLRAFAGRGVQARVAGLRYRIGSQAFGAELAGGPLPLAPGDDGRPLVFLAREGEWLAVLRLDDSVRDEAAATVERLRALGCRVSLASGDRAATVAAAARATGIVDVVSGASPDDKRRLVEDFAARGEVVAMVGDGVNDAPALAAARVSIALGQGAALAQSQAGLVLLNPSLMAIADAVETARLARRVMAQNLAWAAAYNAIALPMAMSGVLVPWMASAGMSLSSLAVVANALRVRPLRRRSGLIDVNVRLDTKATMG